MIRLLILSGLVWAMVSMVRRVLFDVGEKIPPQRPGKSRKPSPVQGRKVIDVEYEDVDSSRNGGHV